MSEHTSLYTESSRSTPKLSLGDRSNVFTKLGASVISPSQNNGLENKRISKSLDIKIEKDTNNYKHINPTLGMQHLYGYRAAKLEDVTFVRELAGFKNDELIREPRYMHEAPIPKGRSTLKHPSPPINIIETNLDIFSNADIGKLVKRPVGNALVLQDNLIITINGNIPNPEAAVFLRTYNKRQVVLDSLRAFITSREFEYTIIGIEPVSAHSLDIRIPFKLSIGNIVKMMSQDPWLDMKVVGIDQKYFCFTSGRNENFLPGTGVFSENWELQGIYSHSASHLNFALRFEPILAHLRLNRGPFYNTHLENMIDPYVNHTDTSKFSPHYQSWIKSVQSLSKYFKPETFANM